jgi:two-component system NtrC family sensor kinase
VHSLIDRQIKKYLKGEHGPELAPFLEAVGATYRGYDNDRQMLEQSMELMSDELNARNRELREQLDGRQRVEDELRRSNENLREINRKLETAQNQLLQADKMASIGQLAAGVAHEINNPIGYIHSNLTTLERYVNDLMCLLALYERGEDQLLETDLCDVLKEKKGEIDLAYLRDDLPALMSESKEGISRVKKIVQDLKDFSHVDEADWQWADLRKGLDSTLNIVRNEIRTRAEVICQYGDIPEIYCIASRLNQVFMNILVNAAHAVRSNGIITISTGWHGQEVWVKIADTGCGIPKENLQRIFDAFYTTKPIGQGTGLGLSLSYSIVQKHHGRIEVESEVGKGTTFTVWLPIEQPGIENSDNAGSP